MAKSLKYLRFQQLLHFKSICATCSAKFHSAKHMLCSQEKHMPKLYSSANNMDPGPIPP